MDQFLDELKRRNVFRVAAFYAAAAWLAVQIATQVFPFFDIPNWAVRVVVIAVVAGFPFALVFAWFYELTPEGLKRESDIALDQSITRQTGRRLDRWIIATLALAVVFLLATLLVPHGALPTSRAAPPAEARNSVAVLPFENLSADKDNAYFASGMQDMILTKLSGIGELKVISRTSTEKYASHPDDLKTIAQQLGVATILEGSVQRAAGQVLVNVQLIDANTDAHIWAEAYSRSLENIFGVEGEVAQKIAEALQAKLTPAESQQLASPPTRNADAYVLFLQGEYHFNRGSSSLFAPELRLAIEKYREATTLDSTFALAWARLAYAQLMQMRTTTGDSGPELTASAKTAVDRALKLAPDLAEAHLAQGYYEDYANGDLDAALAAFQSARALKPQSPEILTAIGIVQEHRGKWDDAVATFQHAIELDPQNVDSLGQLARSHVAQRRWVDAERVAARGAAVDPDSSGMQVWLFRAVLCRTGSADQAAAVFDTLPASMQSNPIILEKRAEAMYFHRDYAAARALLARVPPGEAFSIADMESFKGDIERADGNPAAANEHYLAAAAALENEIKVSAVAIDTAIKRGYLGLIYADVGRRSEALEQGRFFLEHAPIERDFATGALALTLMALIHTELGDPDAAMPLLEQLMVLPAGEQLSLADLQLDPAWDPIRGDPRFVQLIARGEPRL